ncbi:MAG: hypothetical protein FJW26_19140 [Acidimicrobiia bacterium]|nr:hypothetical protein [Acidimicrobiia bacterium]
MSSARNGFAARPAARSAEVRTALRAFFQVNRTVLKRTQPLQRAAVGDPQTAALVRASRSPRMVTAGVPNPLATSMQDPVKVS